LGNYESHSILFSTMNTTMSYENNISDDPKYMYHQNSRMIIMQQSSRAECNCHHYKSQICDNDPKIVMCMPHGAIAL
jgi:hypothetical protein